MNIVEAIKTGKPFRRKGWNSYALLDGGSARFINPKLNCPHTWDLESWVADDWEIQEPAVAITRTQFLEAFGQCFCEEGFTHRVMESELGLLLARKLGLEASNEVAR